MTHPTLGTCYYPEHWPEDIWAEDARRMAEAGLTWVRIGEFAWSRIEPAPGQLDFDWLDRAIDTLGAAGLKVILGTPTATPPRWMIERHPDMLAHDRQGRPRRFGSRRHYCFSHLGYRAECRRIATLLGQRYGAHPHVHAWQIDNEYGCHDTAISYSPAARDAFRDWLAARYQSPDALNRAWGNVFWSMEIESFDQIDLPHLTVTEPNPSHALDFRRFSSDQVVAFNRVQVEALRPLTDNPLLHNYMGSGLSHTDFDHFALGQDLDIATWDSYPLGFLLDRVPDVDDAHKQAFAHQGDPDFQAFHHDLYRTVGHGRWWVIEQQPGPVNWAPWNPSPLPGMVRLWTWEAFAHGAEAVCYFRWRQAPFAQEQQHAGLLRPDSADAPALTEARQVADEIAALGEIGTPKASVALVFDYESVWQFETQPQGADCNAYALTLAAYRALRRAGVSIDVVSPEADLSGYALVLGPGLVFMDNTRKARFANLPGVVVLGPRTASRTDSGAIPVPLPPALPGLDTTVARLESLMPGLTRDLAGGGAVIRWLEELDGTAETVFETTDGQKVLVRADRLHYLGAWLDEPGWDRLVAHALDAAGLSSTPLPQGLRIRETDRYRFVFNYNAEPVTWEGHEIPAAGVYWQKA